MATVTLSSAGVGAAQSGATGNTTSVLIVNDSDSTITCDLTTGGSSVEQANITIQKKDFKIITGLASAAKTLTSVKTTHATVAQSGEKIYIHPAA